MGKSANVKDMQAAVVDWVKANMPKDKNNAYIGRIQGKA